MAITYLSGQRIQGSSTGVASFTPAGSFNVRYIVCGGGAGSGTNNGGGGGAGAFRTDPSYPVTAQTYSIIVGEKSVGQVHSTVVANGGDSTFGDIVAGGGGAGGNQDIDSGLGQDASSGSGGGGTNSKAGGSSGSYGYDGGDGVGSSDHAGGGGGGSSSAGSGRTGGNGTDSDITGSTINYCAGGGGSTQGGSVGQGGNSSAGDGAGTGNGVGGNATTTAVGTSAGNGGGGGRGSTYKGGDGSDGIIILRFTTSGNSYSVVGGQVDIDGSDTVITFTVGNAGAQDEKTTVTDVPTGSQFEEIDTRKFYQFSGAGNTLGSDGNATNNGADLDTTNEKLGTGCLDFNGSSDNINASNLQTNTAMTTKGTISMWVNFDDLTTGRKIWSIGDANANSFIYVEMESNGTLVAQCRLASTNQWKCNTSSGIVSTSGWYLVTITHNGTEPKIYVNGTEDTTFTVTTDKTKWANMTGLDEFYVGKGRYNGSDDGFLDGKTDDIGIWNDALIVGTDEDTADSIKWLYNTGTGRLASTIPSGLRAYYNCDSATTNNNAVGWVERGTAI